MARRLSTSTADRSLQKPLGRGRQKAWQDDLLLEDGPKKREVVYENGKQHGTEIVYREDGSKESEIPT